MEIGDPVAAMDVDADDTLEYSLDEMGDMYFDIDGHRPDLMTEARCWTTRRMASHTVTVTATDRTACTDDDRGDHHGR